MFFGTAIGSFLGSSIIQGNFRRTKNTAINMTTYTLLGNEIFNKTKVQTKDGSESKYSNEPDFFMNIDENAAACYFYSNYLFGNLRDQSAGFEINKVTETVVEDTYNSFSNMPKTFFNPYFLKRKCRLAERGYNNGHIC